MKVARNRTVYRCNFWPRTEILATASLAAATGEKNRRGPAAARTRAVAAAKVPVLQGGRWDPYVCAVECALGGGANPPPKTRRPPPRHVVWRPFGAPWRRLAPDRPLWLQRNATRQRPPPERAFWRPPGVHRRRPAQRPSLKEAVWRPPDAIEGPSRQQQHGLPRRGGSSRLHQACGAGGARGHGGQAPAGAKVPGTDGLNEGKAREGDGRASTSGRMGNGRAQQRQGRAPAGAIVPGHRMRGRQRGRAPAGAIAPMSDASGRRSMPQSQTLMVVKVTLQRGPEHPHT